MFLSPVGLHDVIRTAIGENKDDKSHYNQVDDDKFQTERMHQLP